MGERYSNLMNKATRNRIESFAWDCTIGCGRVDDDDPQKPELSDLVAIARVIGRPLSSEEQWCFEKAWAKCMQEAAQP